MTAIEPDARPALAAVRSTLTSGVPPEEPTRPIAAAPSPTMQYPTAIEPPTPGRSRWPVVAALAAVVLLLLGVAVARDDGDQAPSDSSTTSTEAPATTVSTAETTTTSAPTCAGLEAQKEALEAEKERIEQAYKDDKDTRQRLKAQVEEQKKAVEAQQGPAGC